MLKNILRMAAVLCLTACAGMTPPTVARLPALQKPLLFQVTQTAANGDARQSLLVVERVDEDSWRWIQSDALGAPLARQIVQQGQWRNDGFLPPNRSARKLFTALLAVIAAQESEQVLPGISVRRSGRHSTYHQDGRVLWHSERLGDGAVRIRYPAEDAWTVKKLPQ